MVTYVFTSLTECGDSQLEEHIISAPVLERFICALAKYPMPTSSSQDNDNNIVVVLKNNIIKSGRGDDDSFRVDCFMFHIMNRRRTDFYAAMVTLGGRSGPAIDALIKSIQEEKQISVCIIRWFVSVVRDCRDFYFQVGLHNYLYNHVKKNIDAFLASPLDIYMKTTIP
eukprot:TRINITY_DN31873_c0_g1_i1.p1 TRINITY_DN31873_c0_g1~~TRINITY_DN31873_c0_g1_i1.p1  ORF type:complete len:169 (+),score=6.68 TRINITY_DN31873_c0_g1_i1:158-664(+)